MNMKKMLAALCLSLLSDSGFSSGDIRIDPPRVAALRQHSSLKRGKSGVAAAKRAARRRKARRS